MKVLISVAWLCCFALLACSSESNTTSDVVAASTSDVVAASTSDVVASVSDTSQATASTSDVSAPVSDIAAESARVLPVADTAAAAAAFQLYYRERVERAVLAHQRYGVFGDVAFGVAIDRAYVAVDGDEVEVIGGPKDNNLIGTSTWTTWEAYRIFGTRFLELATIRLLDGLVFYEAVSGHAGMTSREVLPGWTRVVDGVDGTISRTRHGEDVVHPWPSDADLEAEMLSAFWGGRRYTYREDPSEFVFSWMPVGSLAEYATTHSFDKLPDYIHVSNCCSSFKRTPDDKPWGGAFWGNHNSRDNFPDLALGYLAAMEVTELGDVSDGVQAAAWRALQAGRRIGDLAVEHGGALMTVDEWNDYETLVVGGTIRPHGDPENEDLGSMSSCPMAFLAHTLTTAGLDAPVPEIPLAGAPEEALLGSEEAEGLAVLCEIPEGPRSCVGLGDAYCGLTWATMEDMQVLGMPWLELAQEWDSNEPGKAAELLGGFQNDYDDVVEAMSAIVRYAQVTGRSQLQSDALVVLGDLTDLMRTFADVVWGSTRPDEQIRQRYEAAIFDALGGREVVVEDLGGFAKEEARMAHYEQMLNLGDTEPWPLLEDSEIYAAVEANLEHEKLQSVVDRYREHYGEVPPIRRDGDGYEARGYPESQRPWTPVERPRHAHLGGREFLQALPLCRTAPHLLDCTWAVWGCAHLDRDEDGDVDADDRPDFDAASADDCTSDNAWCDGTDLDRTGLVDETDSAFFDAAEGCWYDAP